MSADIIESPQHAAPTTPSTLLALAVQQGADLDKLERLMALQERWEANQARMAFSAAFAAFKDEAVTIVRGKTVTDGPLKGKRHAELSDVVNAVSPALSKHGLSIAWRLSKDDKDWIEVTCILRHAGGHFESVSMGGGPDSGPGRNAIQARGSVKTYLERYTATAILGLAPQDADDDGGGGGKEEPKPLAQAVVDGHAAAMRNASNLGALRAAWDAASQAAQAADDLANFKALEAIKDARRKELVAISAAAKP